VSPQAKKKQPIKQSSVAKPDSLLLPAKSETAAPSAIILSLEIQQQQRH